MAEATATVVSSFPPLPPPDAPRPTIIFVDAPPPPTRKRKTPDPVRYIPTVVVPSADDPSPPRQKEAKQPRKRKPAAPKKPTAVTEAPEAEPGNEYELQKECITWLREEWPGLIATATVGGAHLGSGPKSYAKLEAAGYLKGIPDILIFKARGPYHGLFIELKTKTGRIRREQALLIPKLMLEGYACVVVRSKTNFQALVQSYMRDGSVYPPKPPCDRTHMCYGPGGCPHTCPMCCDHF